MTLDDVRVARAAPAPDPAPLSGEPAPAEGTLATAIAGHAAVVYVIVWLLEGALRKWGPASLGQPLYFFRDGMVAAALLLVFLIARPLRRPPPALVVTELFVAVLAGVQLLASTLPVMVAVVGVRQFLGPLFFVHLVYGYCRADVLHRIAHVVLLFAPVEAGLALAQVLSPAQSWVNRVGPDAYIEIFTANNVVRASGTFTSAFGLVCYLMVALPIALAFDRRRALGGPLQRAVVRAAGPTLILTCLICGSRSAVMIAALLLVLRLGSSSSGQGDFAVTRILKTVVVLACGAVVALWLAPQVLSAFGQRAADAQQSQPLAQRVQLQMFSYLDELPRMTALGEGLGADSQAGIAAGSDAVWIENELARWIHEGGIAGLVAVAFRVVVVPVLLVLTWRRSRESGNLTPFLLSAVLSVNLAGGMLNTQPSQQGGTAIALAFALLHLRRVA